MTKLVFVMDLGTFKAYRLDDNPSFSHPRLVLLDEKRSEFEDRISELVTDQAGQFPKGARSFAAVNDMSNGERHNLQLENRRRAIKAFAEFASQVRAAHPSEGCYLTAPAEIHQQVLDELDPKLASSIEKVFRADLTRLKTSDIVEHLCGVET